MYEELGKLNQELFYQGDILKDFPFFVFPKDFNVLKTEDKKIYSIEKQNKISQMEEVIAVEAKSRQVLLLSQTCDIQQRENIIICPVYKLSDLQLSNSNLGLLKKRRVYYWFYLPAVEGVLEESLADLQTIHYISKDVLNSYKGNKIVSLNDWGRHHLGWCLGNYFGRPIEDK